jgi:hypothetical protein
MDQRRSVPPGESQRESSRLGPASSQGAKSVSEPNQLREAQRPKLTRQTRPMARRLCGREIRKRLQDQEIE